ncbi:MAG TPA: hypothetical protein VI299_17090 [Polyangiales bacterium]
MAPVFSPAMGETVPDGGMPFDPGEDALDASLTDASQPRSTADAGILVLVDASADVGSLVLVDASPDGADAGASAAQPRAAAPCGDDLTFVGGAVAPNFGAGSGLEGARLDLEKVGQYAVLEQELKVPLQAEMRRVAGYEISIEAGDIEGTVYGPSLDQGKTVASQRFPLLVAGPGFGAGYRDYADIFRHFASYGIAVLGIQTRSSPTVPQHDKEALETSQAISWMLERSAFAAQLDAEKIATAGHSKGGKVAFFTAAIDPRVDIVFGWDPSNAGGPPCGLIADLTGLECNSLPVAPNCLAEKEGNERAAGILQYLHAETFVFGVPPDALTNPSPEHNSIHFYRGAPSPASLVYMNGGHPAWLTGGLGNLLGNANIVRVTKAVQTAKMLRVFYGATGLERYLPGGNYLSGQGSLIRQVATK